jgi:hypothetical protein
MTRTIFPYVTTAAAVAGIWLAVPVGALPSTPVAAVQLADATIPLPHHGDHADRHETPQSAKGRDGRGPLAEGPATAQGPGSLPPVVPSGCGQDWLGPPMPGCGQGLVPGPGGSWKLPPQDPIEQPLPENLCPPGPLPPTPCETNPAVPGW